VLSFIFFNIIKVLFPPPSYSILLLLLITNITLHYFSSLLISPFRLANINMKFSAVIAIAVIVVVANLAMVDAISGFNRIIIGGDMIVIPPANSTPAFTPAPAPNPAPR
jgi:hypothetical protein